MCEMGATADDVPATERVCKHAVDIESLDARGILAALGASDKELYASESTCAQPALSHPKILNDVGECADVVSELLRRSLEDAKATIAAREPAAADGGVKPSDADGEIRPATMAENDAIPPGTRRDLTSSTSTGSPRRRAPRGRRRRRRRPLIHDRGRIPRKEDAERTTTRTTTTTRWSSSTRC